MSIEITRERPDSPVASALVEELETHLSRLYPAESRHGYSVEKLLREGVAFFVLRCDGVPAGCAGLQLFGSEYGEVKRMYVRPEFRGRGLGKRMLAHLEAFALSHGVSLLRLETGIHQTEAIGLYERAGFEPVGAFGAYRDDPLSRLYEKRLKTGGVASAGGNPGAKAALELQGEIVMTTGIRLIALEDAEQVQAIYAPYVDTPISFELEPPGVEEIRQRIAKVQDRYPWLVHEEAGEITGYAYASPHRERAAYRWSVDVSVYVRADRHRRGIARALYAALFPVLSKHGYCNAFAGITLPNAASVGLHTRLGFQPVGIYRSVGYKCGTWHDVAWYQLELRPHTTPPPEILALDVGVEINEKGSTPLHPRSSGTVIRSCRLDEIEAVLALWRDAGAAPSATDTAESLRWAIIQSPALVLVAEQEGRLFGSVIGSFDGWRGNIYRLAVAPAYRRQGVARALVTEVEQRLARQGARRITALVLRDHGAAVGFWESAGYDLDQRMARFARNLDCSGGTSRKPRDRSVRDPCPAGRVGVGESQVTAGGEMDRA